jgi:hypothetical protein
MIYTNRVILVYRRYGAKALLILFFVSIQVSCDRKDIITITLPPPPFGAYVVFGIGFGVTEREKKISIPSPGIDPLL